jgi:hypothetical protein
MPVGEASMLWPMTDTELLCSMGQSRGFCALLLPCVTTGEASMPFTVAVTGTSNQPQKRVAASPETHQAKSPKVSRYGDFDARATKPEDVDIGASKDRVDVEDTPTHFSVNKESVAKAELCQACNCGPDDRCWAPVFSVLGWPNCLRLCQHPGQPGHESHDSSAHTWSEQEFTACQNLVAASRTAAQK